MSLGILLEFSWNSLGILLESSWNPLGILLEFYMFKGTHFGFASVPKF